MSKDNKEPKFGDFVRLKGFVTSQIMVSGGNTNGKCECYWFQDGEIKSILIHAAALEICQAPTSGES